MTRRKAELVLTMNIGRAAKRSGVSAKMIRHYEEIGLMVRPHRSDSGYRLYTENDVRTLEFIKRSRNLGFSMKEIKKLVGLWGNKNRSSAEVKSMALTQIRALEIKIGELQAMSDALKRLAQTCHGDHRPECPILEDLAKT